MCRYLRLHALRHVVLRFGDDHAIVFGNQEPARNVFPKWAPRWNTNAAQRDRSLNGCEHSPILRGCVLRERCREGFFGQPNQTMTVWRKLRRLGMQWETIEHVS